MILFIYLTLLLFGNPKNIEKPILIKNGTVHTVSNGTLQSTDVLIENGKIKAIGKQLTDASATVIDATGKHVYPGLIAAQSNLGLVEVGAVRATRDFTEVDMFSPEVQSHTAFNPNSDITPTIYRHGITTASVSPTKRSGVAGQSSVINLSGWTKEDMLVQKNNGLHNFWPRMTVINAWWMRTPPKKQLEQIPKNINAVYTFFENAKSYHLQRKVSSEIDTRLESVRPVFQNKQTVFIHANELKQIEAAIQFAKAFNFKMVLVGGRDSWKCTEILKQHHISVILRQTQALPSDEDSDYDEAFRTPLKLKKAGIKFAIANSVGSDSWNVRTLPFQAGYAVAFGLTKEDALKSITLSAAEILGVDKHIGSIDVGKQANIVVSEGDILDQLTQKITHVFIHGKEVDLVNRQEKLYRTFKQR